MFYNIIFWYARKNEASSSGIGDWRTKLITSERSPQQNSHASSKVFSKIHMHRQRSSAKFKRIAKGLQQSSHASSLVLSKTWKVFSRTHTHRERSSATTHTHRQSLAARRERSSAKLTSIVEGPQQNSHASSIFSVKRTRIVKGLQQNSHASSEVFSKTHTHRQRSSAKLTSIMKGLQQNSHTSSEVFSKTHTHRQRS